MVRENIKSHLQRLKSKKIVIEDRYIKKENDIEEILIRTSDFEKNDNINKCAKVEKSFFHNNEKIYTQQNFNPNIKYTYISNNNPKEIVQCPNCGYSDEAKQFIIGCPYCETDFYMEVSKKKENIKDVVIKDSTVLGIIAIFLAILVRCNIITFELFLIIVLLGFFIEFIVVTYQIICSSRLKDIWHDFKLFGMNINEQRIYNDLNTELSNYYYNDENQEYKDLIDFDILDFTKAEYDKEENEIYIILSYIIRKYYYVEKTNFIKVKETISTVKLSRNIRKKPKNIKKFASKCTNCGSPIEFGDLECEYCGSKNDSTIAWKIKEIIDDEK